MPRVSLTTCKQSIIFSSLLHRKKTISGNHLGHAKTTSSNPYCNPLSLFSSTNLEPPSKSDYFNRFKSVLSNMLLLFEISEYDVNALICKCKIVVVTTNFELGQI